MSGLGLGLAAFGIGKAVGGMGDAITKFSSGDDFAQGIKDEVETLLSIDTTSGIDVETFKKTLGGLGVGLAAFGIGSFFAGGDGVADGVKKEVETLLTIGEDSDSTQTVKATASLVALGVGLTAFGAGKGVNALADLGSSIVGFFTGSKSPVEQAIEVGEKADIIQSGADAFSSFADVFQRMSTMGDISIDMDDAIEEMVDYAKVLETVLQGGKITLGTNFETDGLANLTEDVNKAVVNINRVRDVLQLQSGGSSVQSSSKDSGDKIITLSAENIELRMPSNQATQGNTVAVADNSKKSIVTTTVINTKPNNRVADTVQNGYG
jgi:hypothetical protein